jgi:para-aminobenzoate synthetase component 1
VPELKLAQVRTEPLEYRPAADYFSCIRTLENPIWLDSGLDSGVSPASTGRFDILSAAPENILSLKRSSSLAQNDCSKLQPLRDALSVLRPVEPSEDIPFCGGLIGYLGYETNHQEHNISARTDIHTPQVCMGLYSWALILDHLKKTAQLVFHPDCSEEKAAKITRCFSERNEASTSRNAEFTLLEPFRASQSQAEYGEKVDRILEYLRAGDCYQVNLAQHFSAAYLGDCADAYLQLRTLTPTPHGAYLGFDRQILSLSPERFIQIREGLVETWPIKGTAPRSENPAEDAQLARQLSDSEKNRAENLMIVDLMRNDLSRCCKPGSIRVPGLYELHSFPTVHHLVSRVTGELSPGQDSVSVLEHCLPGGSITGAPKRRAMEIISELESQDRGVYCGCIGYLSSCGSMDTNIAIRTLEADGERLNAWGGGGIVIDSDRDSEFQETLDKIRPLLRHMERGLNNQF